MIKTDGDSDSEGGGESDQENPPSDLKVGDLVKFENDCKEYPVILCVL